MLNRWRAITILLVFSSLTFGPALGVAQDEGSETKFVTPTDRQIELNDEGVQSLVEGNPARAVPLFEESNAIGELNIAYLNLGRAYQRLGQCGKARSALESVATAPQVREPPPDLIEQKAREYLKDLSNQCEDTSAPAENVVTLDADDSATDSGGPKATSTATKGGSSKTGAWLTIGSGGLAIAGAAGMHVWAESIRSDVRDADANDAGQITEMTRVEAIDMRDRADRIDTAALGVAAVGVAATAIGTVWLLSNDTETDSVSVSTSGSRWMATWTHRF